jgi:hypothetical protein
MSAYKSYLAQIETDPNDTVPKISKGSSDTPSEQSHNESFTNIEVGRPPFRDYEFKPYKDDDGKPFPSREEYKDGLVQRSWTYRRENSGDPPEQTGQNHETFLDYDDIRSKFGIEADDASHARTTAYKYPLLHSRRVKRGLILIAVAAVVIGISAGVASAKKRKNLPDWEAELAEIQKEEQEKHAHKQVEVQATGESHDGEVMSRPPPSDGIESIEPPKVDETKSTEKETTPNTASTYKDVVKKFNPIAFDRSKGWDGTTYNEAVNFCNELENHSLCPYQAVCPFGRAGKPAGGYKTTGSWLAISDEPNGWVHLGSIDACTKYEETYSAKPDWGMTGKEETTKNIMCCQITVDSPKVTVTEEAAPASSKEPAVVKPTSEIAPLTQEEQSQVKLISDKLQPIYYNRSHGWDGQTYAQALEFCASRESRVPCPYTAVCPNGKGRPPLGGVKENGAGSFVPIIDTPNQWVQLSHTRVCELYSSLYGAPPEWGLTGEQNEELTQNILCCKEPYESSENDKNANSDQSQASTSSEAEASQAVETYEVVKESSASSMLTTAEQSVLDIMHPLWFGKKHGWQGITYDDAVEFCKNVGGMSLCPLEAYCPNGPDVKNRPPLFLEQDAFDGEQWAPTSAHSNSWILVGTSDGDPTSTCKTHEDLHDDRKPTWGEDGTFTHLKENIMCCMNPSQVETISETDDTGSSSETAQNTPSNTVTSPNNALDVEQLMQTQLKPIWVGEDEGWKGGSHQDAMEFCKTIRGKQLCPYSAYCPHGAGSQVMGKHKRDFNAEGELYAPVFSNENHWVMIGQKGSNSATTCMSHYQLEGSNPEWGLTSEKAELKKYIMCCTMNTSI